jgi:hypothetical protein
VAIEREGSAGASVSFDLVTETARLPTDLNNAEAKLMRLAGDPLYLMDALADRVADGCGQTLNAPAMSCNAADAVALVGNKGLHGASYRMVGDRPYSGASWRGGEQAPSYPQRFSGSEEPGTSLRPMAPGVIAAAACALLLLVAVFIGVAL